MGRTHKCVDFSQAVSTSAMGWLYKCIKQLLVGLRVTSHLWCNKLADIWSEMFLLLLFQFGCASDGNLKIIYKT